MRPTSEQIERLGTRRTLEEFVSSSDYWYRFVSGQMIWCRDEPLIANGAFRGMKHNPVYSLPRDFSEPHALTSRVEHKILLNGKAMLCVSRDSLEDIRISSMTWGGQETYVEGEPVRFPAAMLPILIETLKRLENQ